MSSREKRPLVWQYEAIAYLLSRCQRCPASHCPNFTCCRATAHPNIVALHKVYHLTHMSPNQGGMMHRLAVVMELAHGGTLTKHYEAVLLASQAVSVSEDRVRCAYTANSLTSDVSILSAPLTQ